MEEKEIKTKKKYLGLSPLVIIIGMIVLVSASVIYVSYHHEFKKTIDVVIRSDGGGNGGNNPPADITYTIVGSGDITDSTIYCGSTEEPCTINSGDISLANTGDIPRTCTLSYEGLSEDISAVGSETDEIIVPASGSKIFHIIYTAQKTGTYPIKTIIDCPTPSA